MVTILPIEVMNRAADRLRDVSPYCCPWIGVIVGQRLQCLVEGGHLCDKWRTGGLQGNGQVMHRDARKPADNVDEVSVRQAKSFAELSKDQRRALTEMTFFANDVLVNLS